MTLSQEAEMDSFFPHTPVLAAETTDPVVRRS